MDRPGGELISSKEGREQRLTGVPLIIRAARSHAGPLMHVSWAHKACESVLELASARVGWTRRAYDHSKGFSPVPCVRMLIMLMERRLSLSVMQDLNRETSRARFRRERAFLSLSLSLCGCPFREQQTMMLKTDPKRPTNGINLRLLA